jgi:hypothetical protein
VFQNYISWFVLFQIFFKKHIYLFAVGDHLRLPAVFFLGRTMEKEQGMLDISDEVSCGDNLSSLSHTPGARLD